ncbi:MAG: FHA domain-containing protein [Anaerolineae bacterium]|nr:FHA domain-containing protein [Anaerolineae bacterium]
MSASTYQQEIQVNELNTGDTPQTMQPVKGDGDYYIEIIEVGNHAHSQRQLLKNKRQIIGRSKNSDIPLIHDLGISRWHLLISQGSDGVIRVLDLCSRNGTFMENQPVKPNQPTPWPIGKRVQIGGTAIILHQGKAQI